MAFSYTSTHLHSGAAGKGAGGPWVKRTRKQYVRWKICDRKIMFLARFVQVPRSKVYRLEVMTYETDKGQKDKVDIIRLIF